MRRNVLIDAIGGIDDDMIRRVDMLRQRKEKAKTSRRKWGALAACLCLVAVFAFFMSQDMLWGRSGVDESVHDIAALQFNGCYYEATDIPEALERYGLPAVLSPESAGRHLSYLESDGGIGYRESAVETDIELYEYAPVPCRGVYVIKDSERYYAALFCNVYSLYDNMSTELTELYRIYNIRSAEDIASVAEVDWNRNKIVGSTVSERTAIADFYRLTVELDSFGNADFQAMMFDGIPEEEQVQAHTAFANDLRMLRIETTAGLRFYIEVYPAFRWIRGDGTLSYYRITEEMAGWLEENLQIKAS